MAKNKVQIKIYGATYSILTDDDAEYVEGLGEFIDEEMKNIASANPRIIWKTVQGLVWKLMLPAVKSKGLTVKSPTCVKSSTADWAFLLRLFGKKSV